MSEQLKSENILLDLLVNKKWRVVRHIAMIVILAINFYPDINPAIITKLHIPNADLIVKEIKKATIVLFLISVLLLYSNLLILIPKLLLKNNFCQNRAPQPQRGLKPYSFLNLALTHSKKQNIHAPKRLFPPQAALLGNLG